MVNYSLNFIRLLLTNEASTIDVKHDAEVRYTAEMQGALKNTVWRSGGCLSWYYTADGWNSTVYPYTQVDFWRRCTFPKWEDWNIEYTSKGRARMRVRRVVRGLAVVLLVGGLVKARRSGLGFDDVKKLVGGVAQAYVASVRDAWAMVRNAILA
jgi:hypothetical protein